MNVFREEQLQDGQKYILISEFGPEHLRNSAYDMYQPCVECFPNEEEQQAASLLPILLSRLATS